MNPYYRTTVLPDSQPAFFPETVEDTFCEREDDNEESQYSQSLISPKNRQSNQVLPAKTTFFTDECDLPDSQPLFTEAENNLDKAKERIYMTRKRQIDNKILNNEGSQSLIASSKTRRSNEANSSAFTEHSNSNDCEIKALGTKSMKLSNQKETKTDTEPDLDSKNGDSIPSENCVECIFDKELDKRNYYFGNLLIGELQFLPPCMRSEAYVTILKYVDSLKQQHRKRHNN